MNLVKKYVTIGCCISTSVLIYGCGGGGSATSTTSPTLYSVSGTVPGTLIEVYCKDGSYYSINSTNDGTANHPFSLSLPSGLNCKFVMTTNEDDIDTTKRIVTPIILNKGTSTSTYFELSGNTDMGYVNLSTIGQGIQTPLSVSITDDKMSVNEFSYDPLDDDNDNIPNVYEDDDGDGHVNKHDEDDDGDGILDIDDDDHQDDTDGDGIDDDYDHDDDNDEDTDDDHDDSNVAQITTLPTIYTVNEGRLLASQCSQCHGTNGVSTNSWDSIRGEDDLADEIFDDDPIMNAQAHGYTSSEITLIGNWLKTQ